MSETKDKTKWDLMISNDEHERVLAELKTFQDFARYVIEHTTDTCNNGVVLVNATPAMIREKAEEVLKENKQ